MFCSAISEAGASASGGAMVLSNSFVTINSTTINGSTIRGNASQSVGAGLFVTGVSKQVEGNFIGQPFVFLYFTTISNNTDQESEVGQGEAVYSLVPNGVTYVVPAVPGRYIP
jgi:hypothetical protein